MFYFNHKFTIKSKESRLIPLAMLIVALCGMGAMLLISENDSVKYVVSAASVVFFYFLSTALRRRTFILFSVGIILIAICVALRGLIVPYEYGYKLVTDRIIAGYLVFTIAITYLTNARNLNEHLVLVKDYYTEYTDHIIDKRRIEDSIEVAEEQNELLRERLADISEFYFLLNELNHTMSFSDAFQKMQEIVFRLTGHNRMVLLVKGRSPLFSVQLKKQIDDIGRKQLAIVLQKELRRSPDEPTERWYDGYTQRFLIIPLAKNESGAALLVMVFDADERLPKDIIEQKLQPEQVDVPERFYYTIRRLVYYRKQRKMSQTDGLTKLSLHRTFQRQLDYEIERAKRYQSLLSLIMFDIDNFKDVNDSSGHQAGDRVLSIIASIIRRHSPDPDYAARYGGEEFAIIIAHDEGNEAYSIAEHIRREIAEYDFSEFLDDSPTVTISAGIARYRTGESKAAFIERADRALFDAKHAGRNCVRLFAD